jgi:hypothetical protein
MTHSSTLWTSLTMAAAGLNRRQQQLLALLSGICRLRILATTTTSLYQGRRSPRHSMMLGKTRSQGFLSSQSGLIRSRTWILTHHSVRSALPPGQRNFLALKLWSQHLSKMGMTLRSNARRRPCRVPIKTELLLPLLSRPPQATIPSTATPTFRR